MFHFDFFCNILVSLYFISSPPSWHNISKNKIHEVKTIFFVDSGVPAYFGMHSHGRDFCGEQGRRGGA